MLDNKTMTEIETVFGMEGGALKAAIESVDSETITIPTGQFVDTATHQVFTNKELLQREDKLKDTHEKAGGEIDIKNYKKEKNWDFDGKSLDHILRHSNELALKEAGKEPDEKIQALESKVTKLVGMNEEWESKHDNLLASNSLAEAKRGTDNDILGFMGGDYTVGKSDLLTIFNSKHEIAKDGDSRSIKRGGEVLQDTKTLANLSLESVVGDFLKGYAKNPEGGSGGGDSKGGSKGGSLDKFKKQQEDAGNSYTSLAYKQAEAKAISDGTLVIS